ncbi:unnamed protein product [Vitrella brassicaformis CCMP3155]|uniref:Uncharacterized protein n=2 Tax=Vitrella brassicaformis TaxID=1169539 RepID=A0A0G4FX56_VITBC|nr:unnamed protein product [Vitrella brassicaformis CCMP3155]|eukprot:CEM19412.1 unnamed protein product [Vitrella brassicaformis CCMP3155]
MPLTPGGLDAGVSSAAMGSVVLKPNDGPSSVQHYMESIDPNPEAAERMRLYQCGLSPAPPLDGSSTHRIRKLLNSLGANTDEQQSAMIQGVCDMLRKVLEVHKTEVPAEEAVRPRDVRGAIVDLGQEQRVGRPAFRRYYSSDQNSTNILLSVFAVASISPEPPPHLSSPAPALRSSGSSPPQSSPSSLRTFTLQVGHIDSAGQTEGSFDPQGKETSVAPDMRFIWRLKQDRNNHRLTAGVSDPHAKKFLENITESDEAFLDFLQNDLKFSSFDCRSDLWTGAIAAVSFLSQKPVVGCQDGALRWHLSINSHKLYLVHLAAQRAEARRRGAAEEGGEAGWFSIALMCLDVDDPESDQDDGPQTVEDFVEGLRYYFDVWDLPEDDPEGLIIGRGDPIEAAKTIVFHRLLTAADPLQRATASAEAALEMLTRLVESRPIKIKEGPMRLRAQKGGWTTSTSMGEAL